MNVSEKSRRLAILAMLTGLSIILVTAIHFPLFPAAPFLEYDPADIPIFIGTFLLGPGAGLLLTVAVSVIQGVTVSAQSGVIGIVMHILATGSFVLVAGNLYRRFHTRTGALVALCCGVVTMTLVMALCNLVLTPLFMNAPREVVMSMLLPVIIPFNLAKAGINAAITYVVYKPMARLARIEPKSSPKAEY
jgi:riboflavin transporter FmnP